MNDYVNGKGRRLYVPPYRGRGRTRRNFVPNLNPYGPRNLPIRFVPRGGKRFRRRRPKLKIVYGQQQDLAFGTNVNKTNKKGIMNTFTTPVSESKLIRSYFTFTNDTITLCQPIPANCYAANLAVIPLHPLFYSGRLSTIASTFLNFTITRAVLHYVPLIGSTSTGMVAMTSVQHCNPITSTAGDQFGQVTLIDAEINPVWMCSKHLVRDIDSTSKTLMPINRKDIPNSVYVVGSGLAGTLVASCTLFLEMSVKLSRPSPNSEFIAPGFSTIIGSPNGYRSSVAQTYSTVGIVMTSNVPNIDVGEMLVVPPLPVIATDYLVNLIHNSQGTDYTANNDQGTMTVLFMAFN